MVNVANVIVVNQEDKVLLLRRKQSLVDGGLFGVPGGMVDSGETSLVAANRELCEETGISVADTELEFIVSVEVDRSGQKLEDIIVDFYVLRINESPEIVLDEESSEFGWYLLSELDHPRLIRGQKKIIQNVVSRRRDK